MYGFEVFRKKSSNSTLLTFRPSMVGTEITGCSVIRDDKITLDISLDVDLIYDRRIFILGSCTSYAYLKNNIIPVRYIYKDCTCKDTYIKLRVTSHGELYFILEDDNIISIKTR